MTLKSQPNDRAPEASPVSAHPGPEPRISANSTSAAESKEVYGHAAELAGARPPSLPALPQASAESPNENAINKELRRLNRALRALSACNQALAQAGSEQELLDQICDVMVRLGAYRMAWIGYALPNEAKTVRPMAFAGHEEGILSRIEVSWSEAASGQGSVGTAIRENRVCVIADTGTDPRFEPWREAALQLGYGAMIALPLRVAGLPFGALAIYAEQAGSFESSEVELLAEIADNLAYGITAIRTREEGKRATPRCARPRRNTASWWSRFRRFPMWQRRERKADFSISARR